MSPRQEQLLTAIVENYVETADPVGSLALSRKFGYSPATIRAEMVQLERLGFISHPHTSAGRVPTDRGYRHYVDQLEAKANAVSRKRDEDRIEKALHHRITAAGEPEQAVKSAVDSLAEVTHNLGVGLMGPIVYMSGLSQLFAQPEFGQAGQVYEAARLLDSLEPWLRQLAPTERLNIYIGQESPIAKASGCTLIISRFASPYSDQSYIGIIGPTRQSYPQALNLVRSVGKTLEEVVNG